MHPLDLPQAHRGRNPREADQTAHLLLYPDRIARDVQTGNRPRQRFRPAVPIVAVAVAAPDAEDRVFHVAIVLLLHSLGGFALAFALGAVLAEDVAGEDFDFGDEVRGVGGVLEHRVDEVLFVAAVVSSARFLAAKGGQLTCLLRPWPKPGNAAIESGPSSRGHNSRQRLQDCESCLGCAMASWTALGLPRRIYARRCRGTASQGRSRSRSTLSSADQSSLLR